MSHPCVSCFTIRDASGRFSAEFYGAICLMNFTGNVASKFGPLHLVYVFVLCTYHDWFCLQKSVYVSVIRIFFASVGLSCLSHDRLSARDSNVMRVPCFRCGVSCGVFCSPFSWCVVFASFYHFGEKKTHFLTTRVLYMPGVSVIFGN